MKVRGTNEHNIRGGRAETASHHYCLLYVLEQYIVDSLLDIKLSSLLAIIINLAARNMVICLTKNTGQLQARQVLTDTK